MAKAITGKRRTGPRRPRRPRQMQLPFPPGWGGARREAGRKPKGKKAGVPHAARSALTEREPVHVTLRLRDGLPNLRRVAPYGVLCRAFERARYRAGRLGPGFRLVHYSVLSNHLHLIVEGVDRLHLVRGIQGLCVRIARGLNRLWGRAGAVFADRYHDRVLRSPREVRNVLAYVLRNAAVHRVRRERGPDPYSSGGAFDGWSGVGACQRWWAPVARARSWLLRIGWRRHRLVHADEVPG